MNDYTSRQLEQKAQELRLSCLEMLKTAGSGHIGGSMSCMDILTALYFKILYIDPEDPDRKDRDRFILSAGHKAAAYVAVLGGRGFFSTDLLKTFNKLDSPFGMHPDMHKIPGCDMSTGSLGHGLAVGVGMALALRLDDLGSKVFVLMGDGEIHEGSVWEAAMGAAQHRLGNLIAIVDYNKCSMDGPIAEIIDIAPVEEKWRSFGWQVERIDGHDMDQIVAAFSLPRNSSTKPTVVIADTIKGKGIPSLEGDFKCHYGECTDQIIRECMERG